MTMIRIKITDAHGSAKKRYKKTSPTKWNIIDIKRRADKFGEKSITCEQIDCLI